MILNPIRFLAVKCGLLMKWEAKKIDLSEWNECQKAIGLGGIYFTKKWRADTLQPGLKFDDFKPHLGSGVLRCISWLNGSFLGLGFGLFFLKRESEPIDTNIASYIV